MHQFLGVTFVLKKSRTSGINQINKRDYKHYYIMLLPMLVWMVLYNLLPAAHSVMAFQDYSPSKGILHSPWVGMEVFRYVFTLAETPRVIVNTVIIAFGKIVGNLVVPLIFALLLHEMKNAKIKRTVQTVAILPHFMSWVILAGIILQLFSLTGPINMINQNVFGNEPVLYFAQPGMFRQFIIGTDIWREFGFNAIIYIAALTRVDPGLYEASAIDGAGRWKQLFHITLPAISMTVVLLAVLSLGNVLNANFDQVYNLINPLTRSTGDIIDTMVIRVGLESFQYSVAAAMGFLKSGVALIMIITAYALAYKFADYRVF